MSNNMNNEKQQIQLIIELIVICCLLSMDDTIDRND